MTSGIFWGLGSKPQCDHGTEMTFAVEQNLLECPLEDGSLEFFILCKSKVDDCGKDQVKELAFLDEGKRTLDNSATYKMEIWPGCEEGMCTTSTNSYTN